MIFTFHFGEEALYVSRDIKATVNSKKEVA